MTKVQKVIKYIAIAFAIFLIIQILSAVAVGISIISGIHGLTNSDSTSEMEYYGAENEVRELDIDVDAIDLEIKTGDEFAVETNSERIKYRQRDGKLIIEESNHWWRTSKVGSVIIYVPTESTLEVLEINAGAGRVVIDGIIVSGKTDIDMGVGDLIMAAKLSGESELDFGVGNAELTLIGSLEDYTIHIDKGIGSATISGEKMRDDTYYGEGGNLISMDGGIGTINIDFDGTDASEEANVSEEANASEEVSTSETVNDYELPEVYEECKEYVEGSSSYEMILRKEGNVVTTAPDYYDGDVPEQKELLREVTLADNVVYEDIVVNTIIRDEEEKSTFEHRTLTEADVEAALDGSPGVGFIWYNDAMEITKIVFYGENIVWE